MKKVISTLILVIALFVNINAQQKPVKIIVSTNPAAGCEFNIQFYFIDVATCDLNGVQTVSGLVAGSTASLTPPVGSEIYFAEITELSTNATISIAPDDFVQCFNCPASPYPSQIWSPIHCAYPNQWTKLNWTYNGSCDPDPSILRIF